MSRHDRYGNRIDDDDAPTRHSLRRPSKSFRVRYPG
jgi:hypothetical protein